MRIQSAPDHNVALRDRTAERSDAAAITEIYNEGIADRVGTFEIEPRTTAQIEAWFDEALAIVAVDDRAGQVVGYAVAHRYADRCCYSGVGEFSVYVRRANRGQGVGRVKAQAHQRPSVDDPRPASRFHPS
jgi:L-amino acid N-acyltransferase YncA